MHILLNIFLAKVTIVGLPEAQWKAQFCIFDKLKQEGWFGNEEGRLTTQITIPGQLVGRVIGKGGVNVRELQVQTYYTSKIFLTLIYFTQTKSLKRLKFSKKNVSKN